jgi:multiple sugar transport system substrate-binding protein
MTRGKDKVSKALSHKPGRGLSRRNAIKAVGSVVGGLAFGLAAPAVHAQQKLVKFLNGEPSADSVRALRFAAAQYEKTTGVQVRIDSVPGSAEFQKLQASIQAGQPYDIGTLSFIGDVLLLANEKKIVPLNDLIKKYEWGPKILFPMNGNNYWYPYDYNLCWINYRKDLYKNKQLASPKNWSDYLGNLTALTGTGESQLRSGVCHPLGSDDATNYTAFGYLWANEVSILDDKWNVVLDSPENTPRVIEYLDFMADLLKLMPPSPRQSSWANLVGDFQGNIVSHTPGTGRLIDQMNMTMPDRAVNVSSFLYPSKSGKKFAVNHGYDGWVVLDTPMTEEAIKFLTWFSDEHFINFLHSSPVHYQPTRLDIYKDPRWLAHPSIQTFAEIIEMQKQALSDPNVIIRSIDTEGPEPDVRAGKLFRSFALPEMVQDRLFNGKSSDEALKTAAAKIRKVIA